MGDDGGLSRSYGLLTAIGADIIGGSAVAADISISDFSRSAEFNRYGDADVLTDGECANPFFTPSQTAMPGVTVALPQHFVNVAPVLA